MTHEIYAVAASSGTLTIYDTAGAYAPLPIAYDDDCNVTEVARHPAIPEDAVPLGADDVATVRSASGPFVLVDGAVRPFNDAPGWRPVIAVSLEDRKAARLAELASHRWAAETGGVTINGAFISTDRESQSLINGAYTGALRHPETLIAFKAAAGFITLDAATMIAIGDAVFFHVQACFQREAELAQLISAADTVEELEAIDATAGWPQEPEQAQS